MITAVIPHYAYARSDKKDASRISLGGRLVADLISTAGADRVLTMNLHAPQVHGFFSVPVDHLTALGVLADHFRQQDLDDAVVVSPDLGNAKDATQFSRLLGLPVAAGSKRRLGDDRVVIDSIVGDVEGKRAIILDDEIATGGSIVELLDRLADRGVTGRPSPAPTGCSPGRRWSGCATTRWSARWSPPTPSRPAGWPELKVRSVAALFAEAIKRIHEGESVSSLFDGVDPTHAPPRQSSLFDRVRREPSTAGGARRRLRLTAPRASLSRPIPEPSPSRHIRCPAKVKVPAPGGKVGREAQASWSATSPTRS